jgi:hypothetical protein
MLEPLREQPAFESVQWQAKFPGGGAADMKDRTQKEQSYENLISPDISPDRWTVTAVKASGCTVQSVTP